MTKTSNKNTDPVDLLLSQLEKKQLDEFIRKECRENRKFRNRFLSLGTGIIFAPSPDIYSSRIHDLIDDCSGRYGYIEYRDTFNFNRAMSEIFDEANDAIQNDQWKVAIDILTGISNCCEDIINSGDDSAGELGAIVEECFDLWYELVHVKDMPGDIRNEIFESVLRRFEEEDLKGWDWWWNWMGLAIVLADDADKQQRLIKDLNALDNHGDDWSAKREAETAQAFILQVIAKSGTAEEQRKFMYDNVSNPNFRTKLLETAWDEENYDEVLRLAREGVAQDSEWPGLVSNWYKWEFKVCRHNNDKENILRLARYFFFNGGNFGEKEYAMEAMFSLMKSLVEKDKWAEFVETLLKNKECARSYGRDLYIYTQEKMWDRYMVYLRKDPSAYNLDGAPEEVRNQYRAEFITLYEKCIREFFVVANDRNKYIEGVQLLRKLIKYGGEKEAQVIIEEQKARRPRRPALIEELSKI